MAWSDAARAAALEARRRHGKQKATPATARVAFNKYNAAVQSQAERTPSNWNARHYPALHVPGRATLGNRVHNLYGPSANQVKAGIPTTARFNRLGRRVK